MELKFSKAFSSTVNRLNIDIGECAYVVGDSKWSFSGISSPFSRIYYFESGSAEIVSGSEHVVFSPGNIYIIPAGVPFNASCKGHFTKLYIHFNIKRPDGYDLLSGLDRIYTFDVGEQHVKNIIRGFNSESLVDILRIKQDILTYCHKLFPNKPSRELTTIIYSAPIQSAIDLINSSPSIQLSVKTISEKLYIAPTTLAKHFHEEVGINIGQYIDHIVFDNAKKMLIQTDIPIQTISDKMGFCDRFYFSRRFKEKFGMTPYKYRKCNTLVN